MPFGYVHILIKTQLFCFMNIARQARNLFYYSTTGGAFQLKAEDQNVAMMTSFKIKVCVCKPSKTLDDAWMIDLDSQNCSKTVFPSSSPPFWEPKLVQNRVQTAWKSKQISYQTQFAKIYDFLSSQASSKTLPNPKIPAIFAKFKWDNWFLYLFTLKDAKSDFERRHQCFERFWCWLML